jgi:DNA-directed RNA polymerase subunit N (RpoN/RPB10)
MNQSKFDELMTLVLETVSSEEYLKELGIHRPKPLSHDEWKKFLKKINNQEIKNNNTTIKGLDRKSITIKKKLNHLL